MSDNLQFKKVILLIVLSILIFLGLKAYLPDRLFPDKPSSETNTLIDSVLLEALSYEQFAELPNGEPSSIDTITTEKVNIKGHDAEESYSPKDEDIELFSIESDSLSDPTITVDGYRFLQHFYAKLAKMEQDSVGKVRVAYFGDSMNDGDFIVQDVRSLLQDRFGGNGVGYVAITSLSAASRGSVHHKYSTNWKTQSFVSVRTPSTPFGIDGQVFMAKDDDKNPSWVSYSAGYMKYSPSLYNPKLFYGQSENGEGSIRLKIDKEDRESIGLVPNKTLNIQDLGVRAAKSITINFDSIQNIPIYGVDFSSGNGIHVDNFSLRGNSGLALTGFNTELIREFDKKLGYNLIILHYGTNVLNYGSLDYSFYERGMSSVIKKLRRCFPNADILVISTADKASKEETEMMTDPAVKALVRAQKHFSRDSQVAFINLYQLMGGENSMVEWVEKELANKDYTHFNAKGSKEVGKMLYKQLMEGYEMYKTELLTKSEETEESIEGEF